MDIMIYSGNGETTLDFRASEWKRLCRVIEKACKRCSLLFIAEKLEALQTVGTECHLMKWDCHRLAEAMRLVLPKGKRQERLRKEAQGFIAFLWDADGFEKS